VDAFLDGVLYNRITHFPPSWVPEKSPGILGGAVPVMRSTGIIRHDKGGIADGFPICYLGTKRSFHSSRRHVSCLSRTSKDGFVFFSSRHQPSS